MKNVIKVSMLIGMFGIASMALPAMAQELIEGVVVAKNVEKNTITIQGNNSNKRHVYFIEPNTRISSKGEGLSLADIKRGNQVALSFKQTNSGRELNSLRVPNPDDIVELIPVELDVEYSISGTVSGVRPIRRTITVKPKRSTELLTLHVPEGTMITRDGAQVPIRGVQKGDVAEFRYHVTENGYVLISGRSPKPSASTSSTTAVTPVAELPKTASNRFIWLFAGFGLLFAAGLANVSRKRVK